MGSNYDVHKEIQCLEKEKIITPSAARNFTKGTNRTVKVPDIGKAKGDPVFLCILIDASGSMDVCKDAVVQSHPIALDALRGSALARNNLLYICQYLFESAPRNLHPFTPLSSAQGGDQVTILDSSNYTPGGMTALYQTLHSSLQDLLVTLSYARKEGLAPCCSIALITDGEDTEGGTDPSSIHGLFQELRNQKILKSSVLVGLLNSNLTKNHLESIQKTLGFENLINCGQNSAREIRRAFVMASQSAVAGLA